MELRLLRYFLTVAKEQSFTKAAEQLHITQPTLSRQMAAFEEDLGITLFIRNGKKISLTNEGIYAPGNAGIGQIAECIPIGAMEFDKIVAFAKEQWF